MAPNLVPETSAIIFFNSAFQFLTLGIESARCSSGNKSAV
jgi:hypothetical protein